MIQASTIEVGTSIVYNEQMYADEGEQFEGEGVFSAIEVQGVEDDEVTVQAFRCKDVGAGEYQITSERGVTTFERQEAVDVMSVDDTLYEVERDGETFKMVME